LDQDRNKFFKPLTGRPALRPAVFLWRMARLQSGLAVSATIVVTLLGLVEGLALTLLLPLLGTLGLDTGARAGGPARMIGRFFAAAHIPFTLPTILGVFFVAGAAQIALTALQQYLIVVAGERLTATLRLRVFEGASRAGWRTLAAGRGGYLVNAVVSEALRVGVIYGNAITAFGMVLNFAIYMALSAWVSWQFTVAVAVVGAISMVMLRSLYRSSRRFGAYTSAATNRMQEVLNEHILAAKLIRTFGAGAWSRGIFARSIADVAEYSRRNQVNTLIVKASAEPIGLVMLIVMIYSSITLFHLPVAELLVLLVIFYRITPRMVGLQELLQRIAGVLPGYESIVSTIERLEHAPERGGTRQLDRLNREIRLEGITIRQGLLVVLDRLSLTIPARQTIALIGASGGGKTTLLDVLAGVLPPDEGTMFIDGVPLEQFDLDSFRSRIAAVPQDSWLFHDTVRANLQFAKPEATEQEMWNALTAAHADGFLRDSRDGLDTVVGDQGLRMSGGQRQRICVARALLRGPEILLLDEPSSALDAETEALLRQTLRGLRGTMTVVLVSHRSSLADDADVVYQVSAGRAEPVATT
jgi:ATP-binding cassette subfamily C protein